MIFDNETLIKRIIQEPLTPAQLTELIEKEGLDPNQFIDYSLFDVSGNNTHTSYPLLHCIAEKENAAELAKVLIEHGADIGLTDKLNTNAPEGGTDVKNTPLLTAIALNNIPLAVLLIEESVKQNRKDLLDKADENAGAGNTPLMLALKKASFYIAYLLIENGCDTNKGDDEDPSKARYPIDLAIYWKYPELFMLLCQHGATQSKNFKIQGFGSHVYETKDWELHADVFCHEKSIPGEYYLKYTQSFRERGAKIKKNKNANELGLSPKEIEEFIKKLMSSDNRNQLFKDNPKFITLIEKDKKELTPQAEEARLKAQQSISLHPSPTTMPTTTESLANNENKQNSGASITDGKDLTKRQEKMTTLLTLIKDLCNEAVSIPNTGNAHVYDLVIIQHWNKIRAQAIAEGIFKESQSQQALFSSFNDKLELEVPEDQFDKFSWILASAPEYNDFTERLNAITAKLNERYVQGATRDAYKEEKVYNHTKGETESIENLISQGLIDSTVSINPLEFWLVVQHHFKLLKNTDADLNGDALFAEAIFRAFDPAERQEEHFPSHGGFVANLFSLLVEKHQACIILPTATEEARLTEELPSPSYSSGNKEESSTESTDSNRENSTNNQDDVMARKDVQDILKEVARFELNDASLFSIRNQTKADKVWAALTTALAKNVKDVRLDAGVRKALGNHRIFGFWDTTAIKNINAELRNEGIAIPEEPNSLL
ncbi:MAG: ankyrin repeat domain-containing protein [Proteobacteria bacterium]|nr:ankyrin repeat domain-containing protein [Pseudomonadota bacterium]